MSLWHEHLERVPFRALRWLFALAALCCAAVPWRSWQEGGDPSPRKFDGEVLTVEDLERQAFVADSLCVLLLRNCNQTEWDTLRFPQ